MAWLFSFLFWQRNTFVGHRTGTGKRIPPALATRRPSRELVGCSVVKSEITFHGVDALYGWFDGVKLITNHPQTEILCVLVFYEDDPACEFKEMHVQLALIKGFVNGFTALHSRL